MILGYGIIAVPTGIITSEIALNSKKEEQKPKQHPCSNCGVEGHQNNASYCYNCGSELNDE